MKTIFIISAILSLAFILLSNPNTYTFTDSLTKNYIRTTFDNCPGLPTIPGSIAHAVVFFGVAACALSVMSPDWMGGGVGGGMGDSSRATLKIEKPYKATSEIIETNEL
jgi:hypothetical protein